MSDAPLQRWKEQPASSDPVETEARRLAREMPPAETLSPEAAARVLAKLDGLPPPRGGGPRRVLTMIGLGALVIGSALYLGLHRTETPPSTVSVEHGSKPVPEVAPVPPAPESAPALVSPPPPPPLPLTASPEVAPAPAPTPSPVRREPRETNALLEEAKLLGKAVEQLRRDQDPKAALATLQRYFQRYPQGELRGEAEVTRVEALLRAGRKSDALSQLDRLHGTGFEGLPRPVELALQRAELLADARRDPEAARAFSDVLALHPAPALEERALFGRAVCRARSGDEAGMREDLDTYLEHFPDGRFAAEARERLKSMTP